MCRCFAGRTNQTGRLESSVAPRRLHGPLFVGPSLNSIVPRGLLSPGSGVPEGVFQGFCLLRPRGPVAPGQWPPPDSLPFPTPSVAGRQKRSVPSEEAPIPKKVNRLLIFCLGKRPYSSRRGWASSAPLGAFLAREAGVLGTVTLPAHPQASSGLPGGEARDPVEARRGSLGAP